MDNKMSRNEKKRKLIEFVKKKKEERIKQREESLKKVKIKNNRINNDIKKEKKPEEADKAFILNSKRRKEKREKYLELRAKKKEEEERKKQEQIRQREEEKEKKRKEKEELKKQIEERKKEELARKKEEEERQREEKRRLKEEKAKRRDEELEKRLKNRQNLIKFIKYKNLLNTVEREKALLFTDINFYKKQIEKQKQLQLIEIAKKLKEEKKKYLLEKREKPVITEKPKLEEIKVKKPPKEEILKKKKEEQRIKAYIGAISKIVEETARQIESKLISAKKDISNFINISKKEIKKKKPPKIKVKPEKPKVRPKEEIKVSAYKEPFKLSVFLRRNIFKFVFLALLLAWLIELFMYLKKLISPEERLKQIVGETVEKRPSVESKTMVKEEEEKLVYYTREKIDIEGKRDPFSTGRLTMEIMKKPVPTNIIYAKKPDVISIIKTQKFVSILKPEEKITSPEVPTFTKVSPIEKPSIPKASPVEKPIVTSPEKITTSSKVSEIEKVPEVKITPFVAPEKECKLIYRGRMILEGVEYFFIEGEKKTYRVTVGDEIEGYRILKKEDKQIILSKDGILYEINIK